jgi:hypothetical protein
VSDLKEIKARLEAASPGPWRVLSGAKQRPHESYFGVAVSSAVFPMVLSNNEYVLGELSAWTSDGDRDLIVNARSDIERLLNEVDYLREHLAAVLAGAGNDQLCIDARAYLARTEVS